MGLFIFAHSDTLDAHEQAHFTHLHLHTEYSLLDGAIRINDVMRVAQEQEWKAIGMSDHGNVFGAVKFFEQAKKAQPQTCFGVRNVSYP